MDCGNEQGRIELGQPIVSHQAVAFVFDVEDLSLNGGVQSPGFVTDNLGAVGIINGGESSVVGCQDVANEGLAGVP